MRTRGWTTAFRIGAAMIDRSPSIITPRRGIAVPGRDFDVSKIKREASYNSGGWNKRNYHLNFGVLPGGTSEIDPYIDFVVFHAPMTGANNAQVFTDVSQYNHSYSIINNGHLPGPSTQIANSVFGSGAYYSNNISWSVKTGFQIGAEYKFEGDFTWETWFRLDAAGDMYLWDWGQNNWPLIVNSSGLVKLYNGSFIVYGGDTPFVLGQWYWIQVIRTGANVVIGRDGSVYQTGTRAGTQFLSGVLIGNYNWIAPSANDGIVGGLQDMRMTNGIARPLSFPTALLPTV